MPSVPPSRGVAAPAPLAPDVPAVAWDASAYRALARAAGDDPAAAREAGRAAAARERAAGLEPAASPFALWPLLADALVPEDDEGGYRKRRSATPAGEPTVDARRAARARAALAACAAHCAPATPRPVAPRIDEDDPPPPAPLPQSVDDPESALLRAAGGKVPAALTAWNGYLLSVAADLGADPTEARARRLAAPLAHVRERAGFAEGEFGDEMQDVIVAAYDAAAADWDEEASVAVRQARVAAGAEGLARAVLAGRAARAESLGGPDPARAAPRIAAACGHGLVLWREVVGDVVRGGVELEGAAWRRTLWALQLAFAVGAAPHVVVTADRVLRDAAARAGLADAVRGVPGDVV